MQRFNLTVSPDFKPDKIAGWYIFNTWFQKRIEKSIRLELYNNFDEQREAIVKGDVDIIYANPFDAAMLVNEYGFQPLVKPENKPDEAVIVTSIDSDFNNVEDLPEGAVIAATDDPDINMIGMRLLEPADLDDGNTETTITASYIVVAKKLIQGDAQVGFFLKEAYDDLSSIVKSKLKVLIESDISVIYHSILVGPKLVEHKAALAEALLTMKSDAKGPGVLEALGIDGWETMSDEDAYFMIDLMETLKS